jgi:hypothetical protein
VAFNAQTCDAPAAKKALVVLETVAGMFSCPSWLLPQHVTAPGRDSEHVYSLPATTWICPDVADAGTVVWPLLLRPQHVTPPATDRAHVW